MRNINREISTWVECSNDIWSRWFAARVNGTHDFVNIERALLQAFVIDFLKEQGYELIQEEVFPYIQVRYIHSFQGVRSVYLQQKSGNIFGQLKKIILDQDVYYRIRSIDTTGSMLDGKPYVEVQFNDHFILEPIKNVDFYLVCPLRKINKGER